MMALPKELMEMWEKHGGWITDGGNHGELLEIPPENFEKFCEEFAEKATRMGVKLSRHLINQMFDGLKKKENNDG